MKKMILFICFIPLVNFAKGNNGISIPVIEISDSNFYNLLDSILELDKNCSYFSDTLPYSVFIYDTIYHGLPFYYLIFEGNPDISSFFSFERIYIGSIKYNNHYFFIQNKSQLFENELILTDKNHLFDNTLKGRYPLAEDDSWAIRHLGFHNGIIYYLGSINSDVRCPCNPVVKTK